MTITTEQIMTTLQHHGDGIGSDAIAERLYCARADVRKPVANCKTRGLIESLTADGEVLYLLTDKGRAWRPSTPEQRGLAGAEAALTGAYQIALSKSGVNYETLGEITVAAELLAEVVESGEIEPSEMDLAELAERAADELRNARALIAKLEHLLASARNEADHLRAHSTHAGSTATSPPALTLEGLISRTREHLPHGTMIEIDHHAGSAVRINSGVLARGLDVEDQNLSAALTAIATLHQVEAVPF
jgi:hypothetical protein